MEATIWYTTAKCFQWHVNGDGPQMSAEALSANRVTERPNKFKPSARSGDCVGQPSDSAIDPSDRAVDRAIDHEIE